MAVVRVMLYDASWRLLESRIDNAAKLGHQQNFKSVLQQVFQRKGLGAPNYQVLDERGPDHAKCFKVAVAAAGRRFGGCWGPNKKQAEQQAALTALLDLQLASADGVGDIHLDDFCWNDDAVPHAILVAATTDLREPPPAEPAPPVVAAEDHVADVDEDASPTDIDPACAAESDSTI